MKFSEVENIISRIRYKYNWRFSCRRDNERVRIDLISDEPDASQWREEWHNPHQMWADRRSPSGFSHSPPVVSIVSSQLYHLEQIQDERHLIYMLSAEIKKKEHHEFKEWFRLDGKLMDEPHPMEPFNRG